MEIVREALWRPALAACVLVVVCVGQEVRSTLHSLDVGGTSIAFGSPVTVVAQAYDDAGRRWADPNNSVWLRVLATQGEALPGSSEVWLRTSAVAVGEVEHGSRLRLEGEIQDAVDFGGVTRFSFLTRSSTAVVRDPNDKVKAVASKPDEVGEVARVDLTKSVGKQVELAGTVWSLNGEWWFDVGVEVLLANARGRQRTFPTDWHAQKATVRGLLRQQLRGPLHQHSGLDPDDALKLYPVVFGAEVELAIGAAAAVETGEAGRFRVVYDEAPRLRDRVYDLLAAAPVLRNVPAGASQAKLFAWRNWPYIDAIISAATPEMLDVCAGRMSDATRDHALRLIYAGILATRGDERGQVFLRESLAKKGEVDRDAIFVVGALADWLGARECDLAWAEEPVLRCLQLDPSVVVVYSDCCQLLVHMRSAVGVVRLVELYRDPVRIGSESDPFLFRSPLDTVMHALLKADAQLLSNDLLLDVARFTDQRSGRDRAVARALLDRDEPRVVGLFVARLSESFWYTTFRDGAGPAVLAAIRKVLPELKDEVRHEAQMLLVHHAADAANQLIARISAPTMVVARLSRICWELSDVEGGERGALPVARFFRQRLLTGAAVPGVDAFQVRSIIRFLGRSSDPLVVAEMIELLDANFDGVASQYVSAQGMRNCVSAQLAEMTGESFGRDAKSWREWLRRQ